MRLRRVRDQGKRTNWLLIKRHDGLPRLSAQRPHVDGGRAALAGHAAGAPLSMPLHWSQVRAGLDPLRFTMVTAPALLSKNKPWQDYFESEVPLKAAIQKFVKSGNAGR